MVHSLYNIVYLVLKRVNIFNYCPLLKNQQKRLISFCFFLLLFSFAIAQEYNKDSLLLVLRSAEQDTVKARTLHFLFRKCLFSGDLKEALFYAQQELEISNSISSDFEKAKKRNLSNTYGDFGSVYSALGDYTKALENHTKALVIRIEIGDKKGTANAGNNIGNIYFFQGNYEKALSYYLKSLAIREEIGDKPGLGDSYGNIGIIYKKQNYLNKALKNHLMALSIRIELNDKRGISSSYTYIGNIMTEQGNAATTESSVSAYYKKALENHKRSLELSLEIGTKPQTAYCYSDIATIYWQQACFKYRFGKPTNDTLLEKALEYYFKGLEMRKEQDDKRGLGMSYTDIARVYLEQNKLDKALYYLNKSIPLSLEIGNKVSLKDDYGLMADLNEKKHDYKQAFVFLKLFNGIKDSLLNEATGKQLAEMNTKYETEKKDKRIQLLNIESEKQNLAASSESKRQKIVIVSVSAGLLFVLVFAFFIFRSNRQKQRDNIIISKQKEETERKNKIIEEQKHLVEEKNKDITDSITYAKRIQEAILPAKEIKYKIFPDAFVLFQPRDIVSGDFYWFAEKNGKRLISAIDCTGHGVPGAFMSMIGNAFLHEAVNEKGITQPNLILSELRNNIISSLKQTDVADSTRDGMDMAILSFDEKNEFVEFAGANNPLWLIRNAECIEYEPDKRPIGYFRGTGLPFTNHKIKLMKGDTLYIFTDGYSDQFGGPKGKKFKGKQLKNILLSIQNSSMSEQEKFLTKTFSNWKGDLEQIDDVCVIGIRL